METRKINYKSDFDFILYLKDCKDKEKTVPFPECDFDVRFWTSVKANAYTASYKSGTYTNCLRTEDGGMHFVFDSHHLGAGTLKWEPHFEFPNGLYPDSTQDIFSKEPLGIELVDGPGECPTTAEVEVMLPYIKGDPFTWEDFTPEQIKELQRPAMEAADSVKDLEKSIETAEYDRNIAERNRKDEERVRANQESIRRTQEAFRENHERSREKAEESRQTSEEDREAAEDERVSAENARAEEFATWEAEIGSKADKSELSNVLAEEPLTPGNFPGIGTYTREELKMDLFIDMWNEAWGKYGKYDPANAPDAEHPFMGNEIWMTYEEAVEIYQYSYTQKIYDATSLYEGAKTRTLLPLRCATLSVFLNGTFGSSTLKRVSIIGPGWDNFIGVNKMDQAFRDCRGLEVVESDKPLRATYTTSTMTNTFKNCLKLREIRFSHYRLGFDIHWSPLLSLASVQSFIPPSPIANGATITVHPDVYAKLTDETNTEWHALIAQAAEKNITFATV